MKTRVPFSGEVAFVLGEDEWKETACRNKKNPSNTALPAVQSGVYSCPMLYVSTAILGVLLSSVPPGAACGPVWSTDCRTGQFGP